jgi:hypothetical protein
MLEFIAGGIAVLVFYAFRSGWRYRNFELLEMRVNLLEHLLLPKRQEIEYKPTKRKAGRPPGSKNKKPRDMTLGEGENH